MKDSMMNRNSAFKPLRFSMVSSAAALTTVSATVFALALCASAAHAQSSTSSTNKAEPTRIVAVGGVVTEILYALGKDNLIAAVDTTSLFPPQALKDKPNIGYVRALSAEGVLSTMPSLIIAIEGAGPPDAIKLLTEAGVRVARVPDEASEGGVIAKIEAVSALVSAGNAAPELMQKVKVGFAQLAADRAKVAKPRRILFVLALQNDRPMVGGRNSAADAIIRLAGGINAGTEVDGYKPMTDEAVIAAAPDVILMMSRGTNPAHSADVFALPAFSVTPAAAAKSLVMMDGLYLLGFGPRTPSAAHDLMASVYPELGLRPVAKQ